MAIDIKREKILPLKLATEKWMPPWDGTRGNHLSRLRRAITRGELEAVRLGTQWCTSLEAIQRWGERMAEAALTGTAATFQPPELLPDLRTPTQRKKDIEQAKRELDARKAAQRRRGRPRKVRTEPAGT
jgi:hypothetical protein